MLRSMWKNTPKCLHTDTFPSINKERIVRYKEFCVEHPIIFHGQVGKSIIILLFCVRLERLYEVCMTLQTLWQGTFSQQRPHTHTDDD